MESQAIGDNGSIVAQTDKIDEAPTDGLNGVNNSLSYRVHEIERHFHSRERWRGLRATQTATLWADDVLTPFQAVSGNNTYGAAIQVLGAGDTPIIAGSVKFDPYKMHVSGLSTDTDWKIQMIYGDTDPTTALAAGQFTEIMTSNVVTGPKTGGEPLDFRMPRVRCGIDKIWVRVWNATLSATCDFTIGIHEYEG